MIQMQLAVETGSSALYEFASVAGVSAQEFASAFKKDAASAITSFIKGLKDTSKTGKSTIAVLNDMNIKEVTLRDTLLRAAGAHEVFSNAVLVGNDAWKENTALANEANQRYQTLESKLEILKNVFNDIGITISTALNEPMRSAVDAATQAGNQLGEAFKSDAMQSALTIIGDGFTSLIEVIGKVVSTVLPPLISIIALVIENFDWLKFVLLGIVVAMKINSVVLGVRDALKAAGIAAKAAAGNTAILTISTKLSAIEAAKQTATLTVGQAIIGLFGKQVTFAAVKTAIWNAVLAANPLGAVAAIVGVVVAAIGIFIAVSGRANNETKKLTESTKLLREENEELNKSFEENAENFDKSLSSVEQTDGAVQGLMGSLIALNDVEGKSAAEQAELNTVVEQLNKNVDGLNLSYDEQNDILSMSIEQIQSYIQSQKDAALAQVYAERATEILKERVAAEEQLAETQKQLQAIQEEHNEVLGTAIVATGYYVAAGGKLAKQHLELTEDAAALNKVIGEADGKYEEATKASANHALQSAKTAEVFEVSAEEMTTAFEKYLSTLDEKGYEKALKDHEKVIESWVTVGTNMFKKMETASETSMKQANDNLLSNKKSMTEYRDNMKLLADSGVSDEFLMKIDSMGAEGVAFVKRIADSLKSENPKVRKAAKELLESMDKTTQENEALSIKIAEESAERMAKARLEGYTSQDERIEEAAKDNIIETKKAAQGEIDNQNFSELGKNIVAGIAHGVTTNSSLLSSAVANLSFAAQKIFQKSNEIKSPSKKYAKFGGYMIDGVVIGWQEGEADLLGAISDVSQSAQEAMRDADGFLHIGEKQAKSFADGFYNQSDQVQKVIQNTTGKNIKAVEEWLDNKDNKIELSAQEEAQLWQSLAQDYKGSIDQRIDLDNRALESTQKALDESLQANKITVNQLIATWQTFIDSYEKGSILRQQAEIQQFNAVKDLFDKRKQVIDISKKDELRVLDALSKQYKHNASIKAQLDQESFKVSKEWLSELEEIHGMTAQQIVDFWQREAKKYQEGTLIKREADKELLKAKRVLFEEQKKNDIQALEKTRDVHLDSLKKQEEAALQSLSTQQENLEKNLNAQKEAVESTAQANSEAIKQASEQNIKQYEQEFAAKLKLLDEETNAEVAALQAEISAIDAKTKAEDDAKKENDDQEKLIELRNKLNVASGDERISIQKQINELLSSINRRAQLKERDEQKNSLRDQIEEVKKKAAEKKEILEAEKNSVIENEKQSTQATIEGINTRAQAMVASYTQQIESSKASYEQQMQNTKDYYAQLSEDAQKTYDQELEQLSQKTLKATDALSKDLGNGLKKMPDLFGKAGKDSADAFIKELQKGVKQAHKIKNEFVDFSGSGAGGGNAFVDFSGSAKAATFSAPQNDSPPVNTFAQPQARAMTQMTALGQKFALQNQAPIRKNAASPSQTKPSNEPKKSGDIIINNHATIHNEMDYQKMLHRLGVDIMREIRFRGGSF